MKLANYDEFENVCLQRGLNADVYLKQIDELIKTQGLYNLEFLDVTSQNYTDTFMLVSDSVWEISDGENTKEVLRRDFRKYPDTYKPTREIIPPTYKFILS